jgi:hypothetical protein
VPDRCHTESSQVLGREPWQYLGIDLVVVEDGLVTLQAQLPQPSRDVHRVPRSDRDGKPDVTRMMACTRTIRSQASPSGCGVMQEGAQGPDVRRGAAGGFHEGGPLVGAQMEAFALSVEELYAARESGL